MSDSKSFDVDPGQNPDPPSAHAELWAGVLERIVQGFTHDLNNRLLVLVGVRDLAEPPGGVDAGLLELMDRELDGLDRETRLMRRLVIAEDHVEVVDPRDLLTTARALHRRHRGLHTVEVEWSIPDGMPAVRARPSSVVRALLLLLAGSAEAALEAGARDATVEVTVEDGRIVVRLSPPPGEPRRSYLDAAAERLGAESGTVAADDGTCSLTMAAVDG